MEILAPNPLQRLPEGSHHFSYVVRRPHMLQPEYWELKPNFHKSDQSDFYNWWWLNFIQPYVVASDALERRARRIMWQAGVAVDEFTYLACVRFNKRTPQFRHVCRLVVNDGDFATLAGHKYLSQITYDESAQREDRVRAVIYGLSSSLQQQQSQEVLIA